jgi:hypothetical protein
MFAPLVRPAPGASHRAFKLALGIMLAFVLLAPSFALAGSRSFSSGTCLGGGYTYKYTSSTQGGTFHTQGSNCFKTVQLTFWSPDGTGWVTRSWVTGWGATISDSVPLSADAYSYHEFVQPGWAGQAGETCTWLPGAC